MMGQKKHKFTRNFSLMRFVCRLPAEQIRKDRDPPLERDFNTNSIKGFTLIELIMVIVIVGILTAIAIPKFISLRQETERAVEEATIGAVRSGINIKSATEEIGK